jgi:hypothetical protein
MISAAMAACVRLSFGTSTKIFRFLYRMAIDPFVTLQTPSSPTLRMSLYAPSLSSLPVADSCACGDHISLPKILEVFLRVIDRVLDRQRKLIFLSPAMNSQPRVVGVTS